MIQVNLYKNMNGRILYFSVAGHSEDPTICAAASMAVSISRKLLGGSGMDIDEGGKYEVNVSITGIHMAKAIVDSLIHVSEYTKELVVDEYPGA